MKQFEGYGNKELRIAMLGMVDGNGHPYSWSAIFNGYNRAAMAACPYAGIPAYLDKQPPETLGIAGARVTHIWTDDPDAAPRVAEASLIETVVDAPEQVLGEVDAVIIATDKGEEHVARCRPFVDSGLPIFVDKPLVDNTADLKTFRDWVAEGKPILSGSALRFAKEFLPYQLSTAELGPLRYAMITTAKSWERYGIHALSGIYPILGPGFVSVRNTGDAQRNVAHLKHASGVDVNVIAIDDMYGGFGALQLCGVKGSVQAQFSDTYYAFKAQLLDFTDFLRTGASRISWAETEELMRLVIAGLESRAAGGEEVFLDTLAG